MAANMLHLKVSTDFFLRVFSRRYRLILLLNTKIGINVYLERDHLCEVWSGIWNFFRYSWISIGDWRQQRVLKSIKSYSIFKCKLKTWIQGTLPSDPTCYCNYTWCIKKPFDWEAQVNTLIQDLGHQTHKQQTRQWARLFRTALSR